MAETSQARALKNYRKRLSRRGLARFEVLAPEGDRELIRHVARCLAENGQEAVRLREAINPGPSSTLRKKGGIFAALRRSPLVGEEVQATRDVTAGRKIDL